MSKQILRHFKADGLAAIIELGFVPDLVRLTLDEGTNPDVVTWFKRMFDDEAIFGHLTTGSSGAISRLTTAATGISAYDAAVSKVMLPAPSGEGEQATGVPVPFVAGTSSPTARSTSVLGTVTKPSSGKETGYIYECTVTAGVYGTEPTTWPTVPGVTVSDGTNTWITREEKIKVVGVKGIQIGADVSQNTNGNQCYLEAFRADKDPADIDAGDVVAGAPV
ncbi:hypothetical protein LCGC14_2459200 [marine sediment metagenome]|uniref:Uncharacterized protein n=1 Tax=marine sediment metagenome TaxID=412755 RepID=A0A0F9BDP9_9ZZZZ